MDEAGWLAAEGQIETSGDSGIISHIWGLLGQTKRKPCCEPDAVHEQQQDRDASLEQVIKTSFKRLQRIK